MPPKDVILHWFGELSSQHIKMNADMIPIDQMTKHGTHWLVMVRGQRVLMNSMNNMGVLTMECLLVQQLPQPILAWGWKDEWEEFFHHYCRLRQGNFWKLDAHQVVDWERYIDTLVPFLLGN